MPERCRCCRCWATYSLFKPHDVCKECNHPFSDCPTCMIVDSLGSREIATIDHRPIGEFDQTPEFWRCNTCEHVNPFDGEGTVNGFLVPKVSDCMEDMECKKVRNVYEGTGSEASRHADQHEQSRLHLERYGPSRRCS